MKPHIYRWEGAWFVFRDGHKLFVRGQVLHGRRDLGSALASRPTFPEACHLAMLAAIHAGVWRGRES